MNETQGGVKRHHPEPLLHRTVRLAVLHTGRGDCSPHKITAKIKTTFCVPLSAVLAPRRTPQSVLPATHHSARAPLLRFLCEDGAFPALFLLFLLRPPSSSVVPSHRGAPQGPPSQTEHTTVSGGIHCVGGDRSKEDDGSSKRHHVSFTSPTTVAAHPCSPHPTSARRWNEAGSALRSQWPYTRRASAW